MQRILETINKRLIINDQPLLVILNLLKTIWTKIQLQISELEDLKKKCLHQISGLGQWNEEIQ